MREREIERKLVSVVKSRGGICPKFVSPGFDGMPDRVVLLQETQMETVERILFLNGTIAEDSWFDDDVTPQMFKEELMDGNGNITVWINSLGGDCMAAAQIYNMLREYEGKVTVKIDGIAASAASVIAMAGDTALLRLSWKQNVIRMVCYPLRMQRLMQK